MRESNVWMLLFFVPMFGLFALLFLHYRHNGISFSLINKSSLSLTHSHHSSVGYSLSIALIQIFITATLCDRQWAQNLEMHRGSDNFSQTTESKGQECTHRWEEGAERLRRRSNSAAFAASPATLLSF